MVLVKNYEIMSEFVRLKLRLNYCRLFFRTRCTYEVQLSAHLCFTECNRQRILEPDDQRQTEA